jgi:hypothetical protein
MGLLGWLFGGSGKSRAERQADQTSEQIGEALGLGRALKPTEVYELGRMAFDQGHHAEDNPFPHGTPHFRAWESGFEDQIYLEYGQQGLDDYYENPNNDY